MANIQIARAKATSQIMYGVCTACAVLIVATLILITGYLMIIGLHSLNWRFFVNLPQSDPPGMRNSIDGTIILVALASLAGIPIGMLAGVYLSEYEAEFNARCPGAIRLRRPRGSAKHCRGNFRI